MKNQLTEQRNIKNIGFSMMVISCFLLFLFLFSLSFVNSQTNLSINDSLNNENFNTSINYLKIQEDFIGDKIPKKIKDKERDILTQVKIKDKSKIPKKLKIVKEDLGEFNLYGNDRVTVKVKGTIDLTTAIFNNRYVSVEEYNIEENSSIKITQFVGTDGVEYEVYHYKNTASYDEIKAKGKKIDTVISKDGYVSYTQNSFSASIVTLKNVYLAYEDTKYLDLNKFCTNCNPDYTKITYVDPATSQLVILEGDDVGEFATNDYFSISLDWTLSGTGHTLFLESHSNDLNDLNINVYVSDTGINSPTDSTAFNLNIVDVLPEIKTNFENSYHLGANGEVTFDLNNYFNGYEEIIVSYTDGVPLTIERMINDSGGEGLTNNITVSLTNDPGVYDGLALFIDSIGKDFNGQITVQANNLNSGAVSQSFNIITEENVINTQLYPNLKIYLALNESNLFSGDPTYNLANPLNNYTTTTNPTIVTGKSGNAIDFGQAETTLRGYGIDNKLDSEEGTINFWIYGEEITGSQNIMGHLGAGYDWGDWGIFIDDSNTITWGIETGSYRDDLTTSNSLNLLAWNMVTVTWSITEGQKIYLNGNLEIQNTTSYLIPNISAVTETSTGNPVYFYIGDVFRDGQAQGTYLQSTLDEISFWDKSFTQSDVNTYYDSGAGYFNPTGETTPPILYRTTFDNPPSPINVNYNEQTIIKTSNYYGNYTDVYISWDNNGTPLTINTEVGEYTNFSTQFINVYMDGSQDKNIYINSQENDFNTDLNLTVCNSNGCLSENSIIDYTISNTAPIRSIEPLTTRTMTYNDTEGIGLTNYFANFNNQSVTFNDVDGSNITIYKGEFYETSAFLINLTDYNTLLVDSKNETYTLYTEIIVYNSAGTNEEDNDLIFYITEEGIEPPPSLTGGSFLTPFIDFFTGLFPDSESLSLMQKFAYVIITMTLASGLLLVISMGTTGEVPKVIGYLVLTINILLFFFFLGIGYIPIAPLIVLGLILIAITYLRFRGGSE